MSTEIMKNYTVASPSFLKSLIEEGAPVKAAAKRGNKDDKNLALIEGSAIDCAVLEPGKFGKRFHVVDKIPNTNTQDYKFVVKCIVFFAAGCSLKRAVRFARKYSGHRYTFAKLYTNVVAGDYDHLFEYWFWSQSKTVITPEIKETAFACRETVRAFEIVDGLTLGEIFDKGMTQVHLKWTNQKTGVSCHGYADNINPAFGIFDLKSTINASPDFFIRRWGQAYKLKYIEQLAAYQEGYSEMLGGWNGTEFGCYLVAVEKTPPYMVAVYKISDFDLEEGLRRFSSWCAHFKHIQENDLWDMGYEYFARFRTVEYWGDGLVSQMGIDKKGISNTFETELYG